MNTCFRISGKCRGKKEDGTAPSHGLRVGIGTLTATVIMDSFSPNLLRTLISKKHFCGILPGQRENMIRGLFGEGELFNKILDECRVKHLEKDALAERLALIADSFEELHERVGRQLMPVPRLREMLRVAGCPSTTEEIGITPQRCAATTIAAQMLRSRYTVLDLVYETGRLHEAVTDVASFWDD